MTNNQIEWLRQINRIQRIVKRLQKSGATFIRSPLPIQPKRITQKRLDLVRAMTPKVIREQFIEPKVLDTTGEKLAPRTADPSGRAKTGYRRGRGDIEGYAKKKGETTKKGKHIWTEEERRKASERMKEYIRTHGRPKGFGGRTLTDEQRKAASERMKAYNERRRQEKLSSVNRTEPPEKHWEWSQASKEKHSQRMKEWWAEKKAKEAEDRARPTPPPESPTVEDMLPTEINEDDYEPIPPPPTEDYMPQMIGSFLDNLEDMLNYGPYKTGSANPNTSQFLAKELSNARKQQGDYEVYHNLIFEYNNESSIENVVTHITYGGSSRTASYSRTARKFFVAIAGDDKEMSSIMELGANIDTDSENWI